MKKILLLCISVFLLAGSGCKKPNIVPFPTPYYTNMRFDKDVYEFVVKPDSKQFTITVHQGNDPIPEGYADPEDTEQPIFIKDSNAEIGKHIEFLNFDDSFECIMFYTSDGKIVMNVHPENITDIIQFTLYAWYEPCPEAIVRLIPENMFNENE